VFLIIIRKIILYVRVLYWSRRLKKVGSSLRIGSGWNIEMLGSVYLGDSVELGRLGWISFTSSAGVLKIGSGCYIGNFFLCSIEGVLQIEDEVMISDRVYIGDANHNYSDSSVSIIKQGMGESSTVIIGTGSWIGVGAVILPGVVLGRNCVIGSNAVVTKSYPDYSVIVGNPAVRIK
jgi:acetyltransferase-like isoleucine patch superfamily enzyme